MDINLKVIKELIEVNSSFNDGEGKILFAYKIGCVGGMDPVTVKYLVCENGVKYSLRGDEYITVKNGSYGRENPLTPDWNLKNDKPLLNYMLRKLKCVSTTRIN